MCCDSGDELIVAELGERSQEPQVFNPRLSDQHDFCFAWQRSDGNPHHRLTVLEMKGSIWPEMTTPNTGKQYCN